MDEQREYGMVNNRVFEVFFVLFSFFDSADHDLSLPSSHRSNL
jgi:hypothetical protein